MTDTNHRSLRAGAAPLAIPDAAFTARFRIRFSHCDPAGIVYYPRYFDMFNGVVEDWFCDHLGISYAGFLLDQRFGLPTVKAECTYHRPSRMGEIMAMTPLISRIGRSSVTLGIVGHIDGERRLDGNLVMVTTNLDTGRPVSIPDFLRTALEAYQSDCGPAPTDET